MKILNLLSYITILITAGFLAVLGYWVFYPYKTTDFTNTPFKVEKSVIVGGDYQIIIVEYCKYNETPPEVSRVLVDSIVYQLPNYVTKAMPKGCGSLRAQIYIPKTLPAGEYYINTNFRWRVNPARTIEKVVDTEKFTVIK